MALATKLLLRQSQSLVMTPQLMQSIKLLQLGHLELERFIDEEMERNPLLERADQAAEAAPSQEREPVPAPDDDGIWVRDDGNWTAQSMSEQLDASLENIFPEDPGAGERLAPDLSAQWKSSSGGAPAGSSGDFDMEDLAASPATLRDHIIEQIAFQLADPVDRIIARDLTDGLDDAGYFHGDLDEVADRLGVARSAVDGVLALCRSFEPAGLFARDLAECLSLQLAARNRLDPAMRALLDHLQLLARRDYPALRRLCGVDDDDLMDMVDEVRALDPRPGLAFQGGRVETIVPDIEVRPAPDGSWVVELNPDTLPRVLVDNAYFARVNAAARKQSDRDFLSECLQSANWLTRSLDQRARTILKVAIEIVKQQDAFLVHGVRHLRPLTLKAVADAISMHESTVSRVTANKFMLTPRGVFELRYFFTTSIGAVSGEESHSSEAVRHRIRGMIAAEDISNVLSDDAIVDMLKSDGVDVARRTVAKYRESMDIPSSVQRRREKRAAAAR